jgi:diguanylate cyclase (GGDEF)-like protein
VNINNFKNFFENNKNIICCTILIAVTLFFVSVIITKAKSGNFFKTMELKTFDIRQSIISENKQVSPDILILTVDDESYEYLINKYGEWPIPRSVYADILEYIEAQDPSVVGFDLLFVHSLKNNPNSDEKLAKTMAKYDNAFAAINFDDRSFSIRKPVSLPESYLVPININDKHFAPQIYKNCRSVFPALMHATSNLGHINTAKDEDGITRSVPLFVSYPSYTLNDKGQYVYLKEDIKNYPYMTLKMAMKHLANRDGFNLQQFYEESYIENGKFFVHGMPISISNDAKVVLNWYGDTGLEDNKNFNYVPMWKVVESMTTGKQLLDKDLFKGKAVLIGTSVFALSDIKSVPTAQYMPGVEIHATLLNNFLDNSFIIPLSTLQNVIISVIVAAIVAFTAFYCSSVIMSVSLSALIIMIYSILSVFLMSRFNIWVWVVLPIILSILALICVYIIRYVLKSRDFDLTYKLATTDGLTDLYNHRFFQDQVKICMADCRRYDRHFSLIMIDIDFFKKFNDTYGHQAGDAVLRGVAHTLKRSVRSSDIVCRYGGEEMVIILKDTGFDEATAIAEKICKTIASKPFKIAANTEKQVTISLGVSTFPQCGSTPQEMIEFADKGLYVAKENGRNQVGKVQLPEK